VPQVDLNKISGFLLGVYLGLAPVYWLPWVSTRELLVVKLALIGSGLGVTWLYALHSQRLTFPRGISGPIGLLLLILSASPGLFQSDSNVFFDKILDLNIAFITSWTFFIYVKNGGNLVRIFAIASSIIFLMSFMAVSSFVTGFPSWVSPPELESISLSAGGFGGSRTGWSNGISFFPAVAFFVCAMLVDNKILRHLILFLFILVVVSSQLIVGGRAGLVVSIFTLIILTYRFYNKKVVLSVVIIMLVFISSAQNYLFDHLRIYRLVDGNGLTLQTLDYFSAGRIETYIYAIDLIEKKPFLGYGFENISFSKIAKSKDVHNLWLKMAMESGLVFPVILLLYCFGIIKKITSDVMFFSSLNISFVRKRKEFMMMSSLFMVFMSGIILSFLEPNVLIGSFQISATWWASCGSVLALINRKIYKMKRL
jgi:hypothetical protein